MKTNGIYTVTGDADDLEGWTAASLCAALEKPLAYIGVEVECKPNQSGGGGLHLYDDDDQLRVSVEHIVDRIVQGD